MIRKGIKDLFPLIFILLISCALYLYKLGAESLWIDELYSIYDARNINLEIPEFLYHVKPIYYALLKVWMSFGESEVWLRGLSIPFGLVSILITYLIGQRLVDRSVGLVAALLLALSPLFINHVQEVRFYSLSVFLNLLGTFVLTYALQCPQRLFIYSWAILRALAILTTPLNVLLLLPDTMIIWCQFHKQGRKLLPFVEGLVITGLICAPAAFTLLTKSGPAFMASSGVVTRMKPGLKEILIILKEFLFYPPYSSALSEPLNYFYKICTILATFLLPLALLLKHRSQNLNWVTAWAVLPSASILFISYISSSIWFDRYLLLVCPYVFILLAVSFIRVWHFQAIIASVIVVIYTLGVGGGLYYYYSLPNHEDWRGAIQFIKTNKQANDAFILYTNVEKVLPAIAHYHDRTIPFHFLTNSVYLENSKTNDQQHIALKKELEGSDNIATDHEIISASKRLWIICFRYCRDQPSIESLEQIFSSSKLYKRNYRQFTKGIHVFLFEPGYDTISSDEDE